MTEKVFIAEKKESAREQRKVGFEDEEGAKEWLEAQISKDPFVDSYSTQQFKKLVYVDQDDSVVGTVEDVPMNVGITVSDETSVEDELQRVTV